MGADDLERAIRARVDAGDMAGAATLAIDGYGPQVMGFMAAILRDEEAARELFAEMAAELWQRLPAFRWESSIRTWLYVVARRAIADHVAGAPARRRRVPLSKAPEAQALAARARTATAEWRRTEVKAEVAALRETLSADDQALLILRVDRGLIWSEVAEVLGEASEPALRKRYERIVAKLRELYSVKSRR